MNVSCSIYVNMAPLVKIPTVILNVTAHLGGTGRFAQRVKIFLYIFI